MEGNDSSPTIFPFQAPVGAVLCHFHYLFCRWEVWLLLINPKLSKKNLPGYLKNGGYMHFQKKYFDFIVVGSILLLILGLWGCQGEKDNATTHLKKGADYFSAEEYQKARIEFLNATQLAPDNPDAWYQLGETMVRLGNPRDAFQAYTKAEALAPDNPDILLKTASFLILSDQIAPAEDKIEKILASDPENTKALFLKARIMAQKGDMGQAESLFNKIISLEPDHISALEKLAALKTFQKDFNAAEQLLLRAVKVDEANLASRMILVSFYVKIKAFDKAEAQLIAAGRQNPDAVDIPIFLGNFYMRMQNEVDAETAYKRALEMAPDSVKAHVSAARFYDFIDEDDKALAMYNKALELEPDNLLLKNTLAQFHFQKGDIPAAASIVAAVLDSRPGFFPALMLDSELKIYEKNYGAALNQLQALKKERPDTARIYYLQGVCHMGLAENAKAMEALARCVDLNPDQSRARVLLAQLYYNTGEFVLARQHALNVLEKDSANFQAIDILANCYMEAGHRDKAMEGFKKLIEMAPENPRGYQLMGLVSAYDQNYDESDAYLIQALERSPFALDVIRLLVQNRVTQKNYSGAHALIQEQLELPKASPRFMATLHKLDGDVYLSENNTDLALAAFQRAMNSDADFQPPYYAMARIYMKTGSPDRAIDQYTKLLEKNPGQVTAHMMLGILMDAKGHYDEGAMHYRKALDTRPRYAPAANNLAWHLIQRTDRVDEALAFARVAREVLPEDPAIMDTLGLVYLKKGLVDSAITEFQDSLEKSENNPEVLLHLGQAYHTKGDVKNAVDTLQKMVKLDKNKDRIMEARALLKTINE